MIKQKKVRTTIHTFIQKLVQWPDSGFFFFQGHRNQEKAWELLSEILLPLH